MENGNSENETQGMPQAPIMSEMPMMPQAPIMPEPPKPPQAPKAPKTPSSRKKIKLIALISIISFVVIAGFVTCFFLFVGRSKEKVVTKYEKAFNEKDKDSMLSLMFPKDQINDAKKLFKKDDFDFVSWSKDLRSDYGKVSLKFIDAVDAKEYDEYLCDDIEDILFDELDITYEEIAVANLEVDCKDDDVEELSKVIIYKSGRDWYILPGLMQLIKSERQKDDIEQAKSIYDAITECLAYDYIWSDMEMYNGNVVISLENDLQYLPQSFQDKYDEYMEKSAKIRNVEDGAAGYAFKITEDQDVVIYISSDERSDEWQVYPSVSEKYYSGEKEKVDIEANSGYSYVQLVSEKSPILGYWQADNAAMYIGYNVSGGSEGFTIYYSIGYDYGIINHLDKWAFLDGPGYFKVFNVDYESEYKFTVKDDKSIIVDVSDGTSYSFEKSDIPNKVREAYAGTWIDNGGGVGTIGNEIELFVCSECGYMHDKSLDEVFHKSPVVELYNGTTLHYIVPHKGLFADLGGEGIGRIVWSGYKYQISPDDELWTESYAIEGGAGDYTYVRSDSEEAKLLKVLEEYQKYADQYVEILGYELLDIDEDGMPECILSCGDVRNCFVLSYKNGKLIACPDSLVSRSEAGYQSDTHNIIITSSISGGLYACEFYHLDENGFSKLGYASLDESNGADRYYWVEGEDTDAFKYNEYVDGFGDFDMITPSSYSLTEAYIAYKQDK